LPDEQVGEALQQRTTADNPHLAYIGKKQDDSDATELKRLRDAYTTAKLSETQRAFNNKAQVN
jgi:hypothetical protein